MTRRYDRRFVLRSPWWIVLIVIAVLLLSWYGSDGEMLETIGTPDWEMPEFPEFSFALDMEPWSTPQPDATPEPPQDARSGMTLHVLEVGKADCLVLECEGEIMVIDGGNEEDEEYILGKLQELGVEEIKYLVNTHPHEDHLGSLDAVVYAYPVERAYLSPKTHTTRSYERLLTALDERDVPTDVPSVGQELELGGATLTVLSPDEDEDWEGFNDWSIVMMAEYGQVKYLLTGDIESPVEGDLVERGVEVEADVLKIAHHGSSTSSRKSFLVACDPAYALITCDEAEEAGAPHEKVVQYLDDLAIPFLRTDVCGVISVYTDGEGIAVATEREEK